MFICVEVTHSSQPGQHTVHTSMKQRLSVEFSKFVFNSLAPLFPGLTPPIERRLHLSLVTLDTVPVFIMKMKYKTAIVSASSPPLCLCLLTALEQEQVTLCILSPPTPVSPSHCTPPLAAVCGHFVLMLKVKVLLLHAATLLFCHILPVQRTSGSQPS